MNNFRDLSLTDLLAYTLKINPESETVKEIAANYSSARDLYNATEKELACIRGLGPKRAGLLKAMLELGFRLSRISEESKPCVNSPRDAYEALDPVLACLNQEHFLVLCLGTKNQILAQETVFIGSLGASIVHPREIFKLAVLRSSASIILAHNHPSGDPTPSQEDIQMTQRVADAGNIIGIKVLDHIIIGHGKYYSFSENKLI